MTIPAKQTLVLGLGNPLRGDDGLGPAVIRWMQSHGLPPGVTAIDGGTPGLDVILTLADYRCVYIVDAADLGRAPGEWARIAPDLQRLAADARMLSSHSAGLADALALGAALDVLPEQAIIFGVQPARLEWSPGLSAEARKAVPEVGRAILDELDNVRFGVPRRPRRGQRRRGRRLEPSDIVETN